MSATVYGRFFWSDYEADPGLRACSRSAQGLWMRMLCIAAQHDPPGYVAIAGRPLDAEGLARQYGWDPAEIKAELDELECNGVFSRGKHGAIISRRMLRDEKNARKNRKNGRLGGNPALLASPGNDTIKSKSVNPRDNRGVKARARVPFPFPLPDKEKQESIPTVVDDAPDGAASCVQARVRPSKRCPDDWAPSAEDLAVAEAEGFTAADIARELAKLRDHEFRTAHSRWSAVFRNWLRTEADHRRQNGSRYKTAAEKLADEWAEAKAGLFAAAARETRNG